MKKCMTGLLMVLCFLTFAMVPKSAQAATQSVVNAIQWADTNGNAIQAHGGGMIYVNGYYYWFGENRDDSGHFQGVSCYRSSDLKNWTFIRDVLTKYSANELNYCWIERPKVMYNASTKEFVMWMHWENGSHYGEARAAVAYCSSVDGNYTYQGSFRPLTGKGITDHGKDGYMSRDCSVFVDTDGTGYFISSANENYDLMLYKLTPDYKHIESLVAKLFAGGHREAPCLFKRGNYYFLLTSGCTGWSPNQAQYAVSTKLSSGWSGLKNIGDNTTFYSQPAFVIPVQGTNETTYLYTGDRWGGAWNGRVNESMYVWAPLSFPSANTMSMSWANTINIDATAGTISGTINYFSFINQNSGKCLAVENSSTANGANIIQKNANGKNDQKWQLLYDGNGYFKIKNINSGRMLDVNSSSKQNGGNIIQWDDNGGGNQKWRIIDKGNGYYQLKNKNSGLLLDVSNASTQDGANVLQWSSYNGANQSWAISFPTATNVQKPTSSQIPLSSNMVTGSTPWRNTSNVAALVVDGNTDSFFDGVHYGYVTIDLGTAYHITKLAYAPRPGYTSRMIGGIFQGSNDGYNWTTIYTVTTNPPTGYTEVSNLNANGPFRYIKYTNNMECANIADIKLYGYK